MSQSPLSTADKNDDYLDGWRQVFESLQRGGTWSGHERNCCFLNTGETQFADVSVVTGLDFLDDGRCVAPVDWDLDGDLDLWLAARTGPRIRFMRNDTQGNDFLAVKLIGKECNRDAIGAKVELTLEDRKLIRTLRAGEGFLTQSSKWVHFGLGKQSKIQKLTVRWPGGKTETFDGIQVNQRFELTQGRSKAEAWQRPDRKVDFQAKRIPTRRDPAPVRLVPLDRYPVPELTYQDFEGREVTLPGNNDSPILISLWATWCEPCIAEFDEMKKAEQALRDSGVKIVALSVDGLNDSDKADSAKAKAMMEKLKFPFPAGVANPKLLDKLDVFQHLFISLRTQPDKLPASFLIDRFGRLAILYPGPLHVDQLLADVAMLDAHPNSQDRNSLPFPGRWINRPYPSGQMLVEFAMEFQRRKNMPDAIRFAGLAADVASREALSPHYVYQLGTMFYDYAKSVQEESSAKAARNYSLAIQFRPDFAEAHFHLGESLNELGRRQEAIASLTTAAQLGNGQARRMLSKLRKEGQQ